MKGALESKLLAGLFAAAALAAVLATIELDPPARQRQHNLDLRRETDLGAMQNLINEYWRRHAALPADHARLDAEPGFRTLQKDPPSGAPYGYEVTGTRSYRLCADFALDTKADPMPNAAFATTAWAHPAGHQCFDLAVREK